MTKFVEETYTRRVIARLERKLSSLGLDTPMDLDVQGIAEVAVRYFGEEAGDYLRKAAECADAMFSTKGTEHLNDPPETEEQNDDTDGRKVDVV